MRRARERRCGTSVRIQPPVNFVTGYGHGALAGVLIAGGLALASLVVIPTTRSLGGTQLAMD
jgi:hypothetical protein